MPRPANVGNHYASARPPVIPVALAIGHEQDRVGPLPLVDRVDGAGHVRAATADDLELTHARHHLGPLRVRVGTDHRHVLQPGHALGDHVERLHEPLRPRAAHAARRVEDHDHLGREPLHSTETGPAVLLPPAEPTQRVVGGTDRGGSGPCHRTLEQVPRVGLRTHPQIDRRLQFARDRARVGRLVLADRVFEVGRLGVLAILVAGVGRQLVVPRDAVRRTSTSTLAASLIVSISALPLGRIAFTIRLCIVGLAITITTGWGRFVTVPIVTAIGVGTFPAFFAAAVSAFVISAFIVGAVSTSISLVLTLVVVNGIRVIIVSVFIVVLLLVPVLALVTLTQVVIELPLLLLLPVPVEQDVVVLHRRALGREVVLPAGDDPLGGIVEQGAEDAVDHRIAGDVPQLGLPLGRAGAEVLLRLTAVAERDVQRLVQDGEASGRHADRVHERGIPVQSAVLIDGHRRALRRVVRHPVDRGAEVRHGLLCGDAELRHLQSCLVHRILLVGWARPAQLPAGQCHSHVAEGTTSIAPSSTSGLRAAGLGW